ASAVRIHDGDATSEHDLELACSVMTGDQSAAAPAAAAPANACGDFSGDTKLTATDALGVLRTAVGTSSCLICVCDVDNSGVIVAGDALRTLRYAGGQPVTLACSAYGARVSWDGGGDGIDWSKPLNWSGDRLPTACDAVTIASATPVVHDSGSNAVL